MAKVKGRKPGSPKGQTKPPKRVLDPDFHERLRQALGYTGNSEEDARIVPKAARAIGCTRATLLNYTKPGKKHIEALLLFRIADYSAHAARWILTGEGGKDGLSLDETRLIRRYRTLTADERELLQNVAGKMLREQQE